MERSDDDLLDVGELARHLGIERRSVSRMVAEGRIPPPIKYGGLPRWRWGLLKDWQRAAEALDRMQKIGRSETETTEDATPGRQSEKPTSQTGKGR